MSFLVGSFDPGLEPRSGETRASLEREERERLTKLLAVARTAQAIPRRLGADKTSEELAVDTVRCKRIAHVATQCLKDWGGEIGSPGDVSREAAQVGWEAWWAEHKNWLASRRVYIATWSLKTGTEERWAKSALVRLTNEANWLEYAFR